MNIIMPTLPDSFISQSFTLYKFKSQPLLLDLQAHIWRVAAAKPIEFKLSDWRMMIKTEKAKILSIALVASLAYSATLLVRMDDANNAITNTVYGSRNIAGGTANPESLLAINTTTGVSVPAGFDFGADFDFGGIDFDEN